MSRNNRVLNRLVRDEREAIDQLRNSQQRLHHAQTAGTLREAQANLDTSIRVVAGHHWRLGFVPQARANHEPCPSAPAPVDDTAPEVARHGRGRYHCRFHGRRCNHEETHCEEAEYWRGLGVQYEQLHLNGLRIPRRSLQRSGVWQNERNNMQTSRPVRQETTTSTLTVPLVVQEIMSQTATLGNGIPPGAMFTQQNGQSWNMMAFAPSAVPRPELEDSSRGGARHRDSRSRSPQPRNNNDRRRHSDRR